MLSCRAISNKLATCYNKILQLINLILLYYEKNELNPNFNVLSSNELKNVVGGMSDGAKAPTPSRCNNKGCLVNSDCKSNQVCTLWRDCPSIATYGQKRCF